MFTTVFAIFLAIFQCVLPTFSYKAPRPISQGKQVNIKDFPYIAFLFIECPDKSGNKGHYGCGSVILHHRLLVTAAHCYEDCAAGKFRTSITVGATNKMTPYATEARGVGLHENYDSMQVINDVAMVSTWEPIQFSSSVKRAALMRSPPFSSNEGYVSGWGLDEDDQYVDNLKAAMIKITKHKECEKVFDIKLRDLHGFCGSYFDHPSSGYANVGDSGGPLVIKNYILIGIVSFRIPSGDDEQVTIFTNVSKYYDWIMEKSVFMYCKIKDAEEGG